MSDNAKEIVNSYSKGFFVGAFIGAVAGAVTALLLAPKSGKELRKDLLDKSEDLFDQASSRLSTVSDNASDLYNESRIRANEIVKTATEQAGALIDNADKLIQEARYRASTAKETLQSQTTKIKEAIKAGTASFQQEMKKTVDEQETEYR